MNRRRNSRLGAGGVISVRIESLEPRRLMSLAVLPPALISINLAGTGTGDNVSGDVVNDPSTITVTPDGRYVAFVSSALDLTAGTDIAADNIFIRDRLLGKTTLVSVGIDGHSGNNSSQHPVISPDGRFVAFDSRASNLVSGDTNGNCDVFIRDVVAGTTRMVSVDTTGKPTTTSDYAYGSEFCVMSPDGRYVAFESDASDLAAGVSVPAGSQQLNIYERDMLNNVTKLVSVNAAGTAAGNNDHYSGGTPGASDPHISADGRYVSFVSLSSDLVSGVTDTNHYFDVFVRDMQAGKTALASQAVGGGATGNGTSVESNMTPDGRYVVFASDSTNLTNIPNNDYGKNIYRRDMKTGTTALVTINTAGTATGRKNQDGSSFPIITPNGRYIAFQSSSDQLVSNDTNGYYGEDAFVRDMQKGVTTMASVNLAGVSGALNSDSAAVSDDGRYVVFDSQNNDLVSGITDPVATYDLFVRDLHTGVTKLCSVNTSGLTTGNSKSGLPIISGDGSAVVFSSFASDLAAGDKNDLSDVFSCKVYDKRPVIATLSVSANPVTIGKKLSLIANGVSDPDGTVARVTFYYESNSKPGLQTGTGGDAMVGTLTAATAALRGAWKITIDTSALPAGTYTWYARAKDDAAQVSAPATTTSTVVAAAAANFATNLFSPVPIVAAPLPDFTPDADLLEG